MKLKSLTDLGWTRSRSGCMVTYYKNVDGVHHNINFYHRNENPFWNYNIYEDGLPVEPKIDADLTIAIILKIKELVLEVDLSE